MAAKDWDAYLQQVELVKNGVFDGNLTGKLATAVLRELENTESKATFSYVEGQCTLAGNMVIESVQKKVPIDDLFQMMTNIIGRTLCIGIAIGSEFIMDESKSKDENIDSMFG